MSQLTEIQQQILSRSRSSINGTKKLINRLKRLLPVGYKQSIK